MGTNQLTIKICRDPSEAPNYNELGDFKGANLTDAVIVKNGTEGGNPTVDLIFVDENGQKYVALITGKLLRSVNQLMGSVNNEAN